MLHNDGNFSLSGQSSQSQLSGGLSSWGRSALHCQGWLCNGQCSPAPQLTWARSSSSSGRDFSRLLKSLSVCCREEKKKHIKNHLDHFPNQEKDKPSLKVHHWKVKDWNVSWTKVVGLLCGPSSALEAPPHRCSLDVFLIKNDTGNRKLGASHRTIKPCVKCSYQTKVFEWEITFWKTEHWHCAREVGQPQLCHCLSALHPRPYRALPLPPQLCRASQSFNLSLCCQPYRASSGLSPGHPASDCNDFANGTMSHFSLRRQSYQMAVLRLRPKQRRLLDSRDLLLYSLCFCRAGDN